MKKIVFYKLSNLQQLLLANFYQNVIVNVALESIILHDHYLAYIDRYILMYSYDKWFSILWICMNQFQYRFSTVTVKSLGFSTAPHILHLPSLVERITSLIDFIVCIVNRVDLHFLHTTSTDDKDICKEIRQQLE